MGNQAEHSRGRDDWHNELFSTIDGPMCFNYPDVQAFSRDEINEVLDWLALIRRKFERWRDAAQT